jgi:flagellar L-ring protein FlgH
MKTRFAFTSDFPRLAAFLLAAGLLPLELVGESLWLKNTTMETGMFADRRARARGDVVTIIVGEDASMRNSVTMQTSRESSVATDIQRLLFDDILRRNGQTPSTSATFGPNTHNGSGSVNNSQTLTARIAVQILDVLPNGNLVLEGVRRISYSGETFYLLTRGICRSTDVARDNTIHSSNIADATIEVISEGDLTESQRKGWLMRYLDKTSF